MDMSQKTGIPVEAAEGARHMGLGHVRAESPNNYYHALVTYVRKPPINESPMMLFKCAHHVQTT
jgi:NAD(P)H-hydrate repair Nnr-like enzyme with NAD(P)H-hydrate dehydratase domain